MKKFLNESDYPSTFYEPIIKKPKGNTEFVEEKKYVSIPYVPNPNINKRSPTNLTTTTNIFSQKWDQGLKRDIGLIFYI